MPLRIIIEATGFNRVRYVIQLLENRIRDLFRRGRSQQIRANEETARRARRLFDRLANELERDLRGRVPVRTGLMRRQVAARGDRRRVDIWSSARNTQGREYAQWVRRYEIAIQATTRLAIRRLTRSYVRFTDYTVAPGLRLVSETRLVPASRFIDIQRDGTHLVLSLDPELL